MTGSHVESIEGKTTLAREPVVFLALLSSMLQMISVFVLPLTDEQQGVINAALAAGAGLITAWMVSFDSMLPLLGGFIQSVISVGIAFGWELDPVAQTAIMAFVSAVAGAFVRTQVRP
jgi:uncharacterized protein (DUF697 family)